MEGFLTCSKKQADKHARKEETTQNKGKTGRTLAQNFNVCKKKTTEDSQQDHCHNAVTNKSTMVKKMGRKY